MRRRLIATALLLTPLAAVGALWVGVADPDRSPPQPSELSAWEEVPVPFTHRTDHALTFSFTGAAAIDVDGDGLQEIFLGGGEGQDDALLFWRDGALVDDIASAGLSAPGATYGATAMDIDRDGDVDLWVARRDGVTTYINQGGVFEPHALEAQLEEGAEAYAVAVSDVNRDGRADLYLPTFIRKPDFQTATFNQADALRRDKLLMGVRALRFRPAMEAGLDALRNTFQASWTDLDGDGLQDLVVAPNTDRPSAWRNLGDGRFEPHMLAGYGFWMGLAIGDIDNDGDPDLLFTNSGLAAPRSLLRGDLRDDQPLDTGWRLLRNDGDFSFTDVTDAWGLSGRGFAWGAQFEDLDRDGRLDLVVARNAEKLPQHRVEALRPPTDVMVQRPDGDGGFAFFTAQGLGASLPDLGQAPLFTDIDGDGRTDLFVHNQAGASRAFLSRAEGGAITVVVPDTLANLGTRAWAEVGEQRSASRELMSSVGFMTDHSPELVLGIGDAAQADRVVVQWPDGAQNLYTDVEAGRRIVLAGPPTVPREAVHFQLKPETDAKAEP